MNLIQKSCCFKDFFFQDAKKGMLFIDFPPVLQLQLKRFEYDFVRDTMLKVCTQPFIFYLSISRFPLFMFYTYIVVIQSNWRSLHYCLIYAIGFWSGADLAQNPSGGPTTEWGPKYKLTT
jgi:hypothetical protein